MKLETPVAAPPLAVVKATTPAIADYSPLKWKKSKKIYHTILAASFAFVVTIGSTLYVPGIPYVMAQFGVSETVAILPYSLYALGQAFGPVIAAPISETYGRRGTYIPYMFLFILFTIGAGFSKTIASLCITRFFAGLMGSPCLLVGLGSVADIWSPVERAIPTAFFVVTPLLGPAVGPLIGSYVAYAKGWPWTQWVTVFLAIVATLFAIRGEETYEKVLNARHAGSGIENNPDKTSATEKLKLLLTSTLFRPWKMFFTEPIVGSFAFYVGFNFGVYYAFFAAFPYIFENIYNISLQNMSPTFLGLAVGSILGFIVTVMLSQSALKKMIAAMKAGKASPIPPEKRLLPALIGSWFVPISLLWIGWSARVNVHWIVMIIGSTLFAFGNFLVYMGYLAYMLEVYKARFGASAMAAASMIRSLLGAVFPLFTAQMWQRLGPGWAASILAFITLVLSLVPWFLLKVGPVLRKRSFYGNQG